MSEKAQIANEIATTAVNSPKFVTWLSAYILGVNWIDLLPELFKWVSTILATGALILVIGNHLLTRKKLKLEIEQLKRGDKDDSEE